MLMFCPSSVIMALFVWVLLSEEEEEMLFCITNFVL